MSDTIQARHHVARRASLLQQRPGALIDAVEGREVGVVYRPTSTIHGHGTVIAIIGTGAVGSSVITGLTGAVIGTVVLVDDDYPTGGPSMIQHAATASRVKPEWVSTDAIKWVRWAETTKGLLRHSEPDAGSTPNAVARLRVDRLTAIQAALGLPTRTMAEILGISRQGLYKWLDASNDIALQGASRLRFASVERVARAWRARSSAPLAAVVHEPLASGQTIHESLVAAAIDEPAVVAAFDELIAKLQGKPKSLSQKMAEAGFTRRPLRGSIPDDE